MADMMQRTPDGLETPRYTVIPSGEADNANEIAGKTSNTNSNGSNKGKATRDCWEVRRYDEFAVCTMKMDPAVRGPQGFNTLAGYIFGNNVEKEKMAMTTPVITTSSSGGEAQSMSFVMPSKFWEDSKSDTPSLTQPASSSPSGSVSIPKSESETAQSVSGPRSRLSMAPRPVDAAVMLETKGGGVVDSSAFLAVRWFGGYATGEIVKTQKQKLLDSLQSDEEWEAIPASADASNGNGSTTPRVSLFQYNDPFVPPWKRRNEVAVQVRRRK
jgi:hypothetical protein